MPTLTALIPGGTSDGYWSDDGVTFNNNNTTTFIASTDTGTNSYFHYTDAGIATMAAAIAAGGTLTSVKLSMRGSEGTTIVDGKFHFVKADSPGVPANAAAANAWTLTAGTAFTDWAYVLDTFTQSDDFQAELTELLTAHPATTTLIVVVEWITDDYLGVDTYESDPSHAAVLEIIYTLPLSGRKHSMLLGV